MIGKITIVSRASEAGFKTNQPWVNLYLFLEELLAQIQTAVGRIATSYSCNTMRLR